MKGVSVPIEGERVPSFSLAPKFYYRDDCSMKPCVKLKLQDLSLARGSFKACDGL